MTIKEMFKKLESYNEIAELTNGSKYELKLFEEVSGTRYLGKSFKDFKEAARHIRETYVDELAKRILDAKDWEYDTTKEFVSEYEFGKVIRREVIELSFDICSAW